MSVTIIAVIGPDRSLGERRLFDLLQTKIWEKGVELKIVFIGAVWNFSPTANWAKITLDQNGSGCVFLPNGNVANAYNTAVASAAYEELIFLDERFGWTPSSEQLFHIDRTNANELPCFLRNHTFIKNGYPGSPPDALIYPWAMNRDLLYINDFIFSKQQWSTIGGFDEAAFLGNATIWDFLLRALSLLKPAVISRLNDDIAIKYSEGIGSAKGASRDLMHRYVTYSLPPSKYYASAKERQAAKLASFLADISLADIGEISRLNKIHSFEGTLKVDNLVDNPISIASSSDRSSDVAFYNEIRTGVQVGSERIKIVITGSFWEHHHNWLCFYNYLEHLAGSGFATYRTLLDSDVTELDLIDVDLLIISRGKVKSVRDLVQLAKKLKVRTLYMIDDNWLTVGKDWPDLYGSIFAAGSEFYDTFIYCLGHCDFTLTYNPLLAEDIRPFARHLVSLPTSVDITQFESVPRTTRVDRFLVGYAGSPRFSSAPFEALASVGQRDDVDILIFGDLHPEHAVLLSECNLIRRPLLSYQSYVKEIRYLGPDILLAPLDTSRTSRSKCPNKYMEIASAGAVGIYTDIEPYNLHVIDGVNGRLISADADKLQWENAIVQLLDKSILTQIGDEARSRVRQENSIEVVGPKFKKLIVELVRGAK